MILHLHDASQSASATAAHTATRIATRRPVLSSRSIFISHLRRPLPDGGERAGGVVAHPAPPVFPMSFYQQSAFVDWLPFLVSGALAVGAGVHLAVLIFR